MRGTTIATLVAAAAFASAVAGPAALAKSGSASGRHGTNPTPQPRISTEQVVEGGGQTNGCTARHQDYLLDAVIPPAVAQACGLPAGGGNMPIG